MLPLLVVASLSLNFFPTRVPLPGGGSVALYGRGPPVVFSSGLFGTMPHWIYSDFLDLLSRNVTIAIAPGPLTGARIDEIATALAVDQVGLLAHSSTDRGVLESPRLRASVLCDPVVLPDMTFPMTVASPSVEPFGPVLVLRAERSYAEEGDDAPPIPPYIGPSLPEESTEVVTLARMAHADLLDDAWAELGAQTIPWMRGTAGPTRPFAEWTYSRRAGGGSEVAAARRDYRRDVAARAAAHLLGDATPESGLKDAKELPADIVAPVDDAEDAVDGGAP